MSVESGEASNLDSASVATDLPESELPAWGIENLPEPKKLSGKSLLGLIGPGIVMCGIQIGGGEWLLGPEITAQYGGALMWIATIAIIGQIFYNIECGRYALYTGEPVFTGFMRNKPGPHFWIGYFALLAVAGFIPALSTTAAAVIVSIFIGQVPDTSYNVILIAISYLLLALVSLPILTGGKVYNTLEKIMLTKVVVVLGFCLIVGVLFVSAENWVSVFSGFAKFGNVPTDRAEDTNQNGKLDEGEDFDGDGFLDIAEPEFTVAALRETGNLDLDGDQQPDQVLTTRGELAKTIKLDLGNGVQAYPIIYKISEKQKSFVDYDGDRKRDGKNVDNIITGLMGGHGIAFPALTLAGITAIGAFAGYAGGGGLSNSTYSNFVRDKGWGMGARVGAIPSAVGGRGVTLSHIGKVFPLNQENLLRWKFWWQYILADQLLVWGPGCFMGMALPGLLSMEFAQYSNLFHDPAGLGWAQALITADGMRQAPDAILHGMQNIFWILTCIVGLVVLLPSQMSILDGVCRRWTDIIWSGVARVRNKMKPNEVGKIYYRIMVIYITWQFIMCTVFLVFSDARSMVLVVANANNVALGSTAILLLYTNLRYMPRQLRPRLINCLGVLMCAVFYLGLAALVTIAHPQSLWYFASFLVWAIVGYYFFGGSQKSRHDAG